MSGWEDDEPNELLDWAKEKVTEHKMRLIIQTSKK